jgi:hypothetical protein
MLGGTEKTMLESAQELLKRAGEKEAELAGVSGATHGKEAKDGEENYR